MPISDWADLMPAEVTVQSFISRTSYGVASYGSPVTYQARVQFTNRLIRISESEQAVARGKVWLATTDAITVQDKILLPDGTTPLILTAQVIEDEKGPLYTQLFFA